MAVELAADDGQWRSRGHLFVVADGMGAHAAGELASQIATDNIPLAYHKRRDLPPCDSIVAAVHDANGRIHAKGQNSVDFHGMGTTCSCLVLLPDGALAAHVGDSRVYRLRGNTIEQLTFDHSLVWEMGAAAQTTEEEVPAYVPKNVITRSLGPHPSVKVDLEGPIPLRLGDRFLLCSDGLSGPLNATLIGMVLSSLPPEDAAQTLVDLANLLGGPDNITAIVVEVQDPNGAATETPTSWSNEPIASRDWFYGGAVTVAALAAAAFAAAGRTMAAITSAVAAAVAIAVWLIRRSARAEVDAPPVQGQYGKCPYRSYMVAPSAQNIEMLSDIVRQLEDLEDQRDWPFDWSDIHADRHAAYTAIAAGNHAQAVVAYSSAVRRLMQAVRASRPEPPGDSGIGVKR